MPTETKSEAATATAISERGRKALLKILAMIDGGRVVILADIGQAVIDAEHELRTFVVRSDPSFRLEHGRIVPGSARPSSLPPNERLASIELAKAIFKPLQAKLDIDHPPTAYGRVTIADEAYSDLATALSAWLDAQLKARGFGEIA